jgi:ABC-type transport system involved in cytochrome c biogenesis permease subunit
MRELMRKELMRWRQWRELMWWNLKMAHLMVFEEFRVVRTLEGAHAVVKLR